MREDLARFLRDELGHGGGSSAESWNTRGVVWLWQGKDAGPAKGSWHFLTISGRVAEAIRTCAAAKAAWGSIPIVATIGETTWQTSLFPSKEVDGFLLPLKAAVRKAERIEAGSEVAILLCLAP